MALRSVIKQKLPIVIVVGATGVGKTKLSLFLAQKYDTEVISADSMQIYKCLNIVTAKATPEERALVPHHLLDILEPHQYFTVVDFRNRALSIIDKQLEHKKMPLVVGGTIYYIESIVYQILVENMDDPDKLLWDIGKKRAWINSASQNPGSAKELAIEEKQNDTTINGSNDDSKAKKLAIEEKKKDKSAKSSNGNSKKAEGEKKKKGKRKDRAIEELLELIDNEESYTNEEIHDKLKAIDQKAADGLHPNNRRKVLRAIEVYTKTGRKQSDILAEQKEQEGQLRWPDSTIMLWLTCDQRVLDARLNARVDQMLKEGLIEELLQFHEEHNKQRILEGQPNDYTKGVFQTVGFKEFHEYLMLSSEERESKGGRRLLEVSVDNMKMATRRYARRQNKMIQGRFLKHPNRQAPAVYTLDTTDLEDWEEAVENKAVKIIESAMKGSPIMYRPVELEVTEENKTTDPHSRNYCETCERIIIGDRIFKIHMGSIKHKRVLKKKALLKDKEESSAEKEVE